jgi:CRP-like cAMP-binding protein
MLEALQDMEFVAGLTVQELETLASMSHFVVFSDGEMIFREGDMGKLVYLIQEGNVAIETHVPGHGRVTVLTVESGQLLGWSSLLPPQRKTAGGRALSQTRAIAIDAVQLWEACQADHDLGYAVMSRVAQVIANRLRATRLQVLDIFAPVRSQ